MRTRPRQRRWAGTLAAACGLLACVTAPTAFAHGDAPPARPLSASIGDVRAEPEAPVDLMAAADDITRQVVAIRGLPLRRPVKKGILSRAEIGKKLDARLAKEYSPGEIRLESRVLKRLGLLPPDLDYHKLLLDLLTEQVAGFYDPYSRHLYIADWLGIDMQRPALAHEIEHAVQDQYFDLKTFIAPIKDDGDRQLARSALVEGDGTAVMLEFVAQQLGIDLAQVPDMVDTLGRQLASGSMKGSPIFSSAPPFMRQTLLFPYFSGMSFVLRLRRSGPWTRVNQAFRHPPDSTEQILHPEKYESHEEPVEVTAAPLASLAPRKELRRDVLGELEMRILFSSNVTEEAAARAAAGWGGDRLAAYGSGPADPVVVIDLSTWDTEKDAREAEAAMRETMEKLCTLPGASKARKPKRVELARKPGEPAAGGSWERDGRVFHVERRGQDLLAVFGVPADRAQAASDEVWEKWKIAPHPAASVAAKKPAAKPASRRPARKKAQASK